MGWIRQWTRQWSSQWRNHFSRSNHGNFTRSSTNCSIEPRAGGELFSRGCDSSCAAILCSCLFSKPGILVFLEILWAFQQPFNNFLLYSNQPSPMSVTCIKTFNVCCTYAMTLHTYILNYWHRTFRLKFKSRCLSVLLVLPRLLPALFT